LSRGGELADAVIAVGVSRPAGAEVGDFSPVIVRHISTSDGICMDIHAHGARARLRHG
jgi:hypothetical protein